MTDEIIFNDEKLIELAVTDPKEMTNEEVESSIQHELSIWNSKQINPEMVGHSGLKFDAIISVVVDLLIEKGLWADRDAFALAANRRLLENFRMHRETIEKQMLQHKLLEGIHKPVSLLDKNGQKLI